jgi:hypothetical protein
MDIGSRVIFLLLLGAISLAIPLLLGGLLFVITRSRKRVVLCMAMLAGIEIAVLVWFIMPFSPVGQPLDVASLRTPDGTEVLILQVFTASQDLYEVYLFTRYAGDDSWSGYCLDPDGLYWRATLRLEEEHNEVVVTHANRDVAFLDLRTHTLLGEDRSPWSSCVALKGHPREGMWQGK